MSGIEAMIHQAELGLGTGEPNRFQRWYSDVAYSQNWAWCDIFVSYCAAHSGNSAAIGKFAYTVAHAQWFKDHSRWHSDVAGIRRGDLLFFDWGLSNNIGAIDHVGIVTSVSGSNVYTIEGNTANVCARRVRHASEIAGYGRPAYAERVRRTAYEPFPGAAWFHDGQVSSMVTRMGKRLVAEGCDLYDVGPGPTWSAADKASYAKWQHKRGYTGADANGIPGKASWDALRVPKP